MGNLHKIDLDFLCNITKKRVAVRANCARTADKKRGLGCPSPCYYSSKIFIKSSAFIGKISSGKSVYRHE